MIVDQRTEAFAVLKASGFLLDQENWSEADTRSKLIDALLLQCLGWLEADIRRELSTDGRRLDHRLTTPLGNVVIEAKKAALELKVIAGPQPRTVQLRKLLKSTESLKEHVDQVADYCHTFSIPIAVLTNGRTYIIFSGNRIDGTPWLDGSALVIEDVSTCDFPDLHKLLSRESVLNGHLHRALFGETAAALPQSVLETYGDPAAPIPHNAFIAALDPFLRRLFGAAAEDNQEVLKHCYVRPAETKLRNETLEFPLLDTPAQDSAETVDVCSAHAFRQFERTIQEQLAQAGATLILIGNLGVGKTMFLRRYFDPQCNPDLLASVVPFFVDYRHSTLDPTKVLEDCYERLRQDLRALDAAAAEGTGAYDLSSAAAIRQLFHSDLSRFERSNRALSEDNKPGYELEYARLVNTLEANCGGFVQSCFRYLREHYHAVPCVVLDNADHHEERFQASVYQAARTLEQKLHCLVLISLQEGWYWHFRHEHGPLASYQNTVFHIPAPRMKDVLEKRLQYAIENVDRLFRRGLTVNFGHNTVLEPTREHVNSYLSKCKDGFFANDDIAVCYECLSNGNIRRGLELFTLFLRSGHTDAQTYLLSMTKPAIEDGQEGKLTREAVVQSIACGDYRYYSGTRSYIPNLFAVIPGASGHQYPRFAACYLLEFLSRYVRTQSNVGRGYVRLETLVTLLGDLGVSDVQQGPLLQAMIDEGLLRAFTSYPATVTRSKYLQISGLGQYMIKELLGSRAYLVCTMLDTPIRDTAVFARLSRVFREGVLVDSTIVGDCLVAFISEMSAIESQEYMRVTKSELARGIPQIAPRMAASLAVKS